jgi:3'-5' exoribonuclease
VTYRDLDQLDGFLEHLAREHVYHPGCRALLGSVLADAELRQAWRRAPCTEGGHHPHLGGLLEHTVAVATLAAETCDLHPRLNRDLLVAAALVHDLGHTRAFNYTGEITLSGAGRQLGHLHLGLGILCQHAARTRLSAEAWEALAHCVLTHHGPGPTGQRAFQSPEALALYRLNAVDADVHGALRR